LGNLINFYDFFEDLKLKSVWKYRNDLIKSMDDVFIDMKDGNSLSKNELKKFSNNIIKFLNNIL
jgi:hypothetical protein